MKGLILFVRQVESGDAAALAELHENAACPAPEGFVGKLVGDLVAHAGIRRNGRFAFIECLIVAPPMRRKRVARLLLAEIARLVAPATLAVSNTCPLRGFFLAAGFEEKDGMLQRPFM